MNPAENSTTVSELVVQLLARELRLKPSDIDPKAPLIELGLDSMSALIIAGDLEDRWHIKLPTTLLWDCPTAEALIIQLQAVVGQGAVGNPQDSGA